MNYPTLHDTDADLNIIFSNALAKYKLTCSLNKSTIKKSIGCVFGGNLQKKFDFNNLVSRVLQQKANLYTEELLTIHPVNTCHYLVLSKGLVLYAPLCTLPPSDDYSNSTFNEALK